MPKIEHYYNEFEPKAAAGLKQLIHDGYLQNGWVDTRSITEVKADEIRHFTQCHFFAGIGGWPLALDIAGWPRERPVWTGSCPCQPFSVAGKRGGGQDHRDLWPIWFRLIQECRPASLYGEQVAGAIPHGWLDRVYSDMEPEEYAIGSAILPACSKNSPQRRDRLWYVGNAEGQQNLWQGQGGFSPLTPQSSRGHVADTNGNRSQGCYQPTLSGQGTGTGICQQPCGNCDGNGAVANTAGGVIISGQPQPDFGAIQGGHETGHADFWGAFDWVLCGDGKARRIPTTESGICILAHGVPERVALLRAGGNAIVPAVAAGFIQATM